MTTNQLPVPKPKLAATNHRYKTQISLLGDTTTGEIVYRGPKGSFHRKRKNPRKSVETDWSAKFAAPAAKTLGATSGATKALGATSGAQWRSRARTEGRLAVGGGNGTFW